MTAAATEQGQLAVSGHAYPEGAVMVAAEAYWWRLDRLRQASSRAQAADCAQSMAQAAGKVAAALTGHPQAAEDTHTDPLAWTDLATLTGGLAAALRGDYVDSDRAIDDHDGPYGAWTDMATALDRREFAAAWYAVAQDLRDRAGLSDSAEDGEHRYPLRAFAAAQACKAAAAIIDAPW